MSKSASPTSKSVGTTDAHPQERIARELLTQSRPLFLGVDGEGAAHYWDSYEFAVAVVATEDHAEKVALAETPYETLAAGASTRRMNVAGLSARTSAAHSSAISSGG